MTDDLIHDDAAPVPSQSRRSRKGLILAIAAGALVLVLAVGGGLYYLLKPSLDGRDPAGARACQMLAAWQTGAILEDKAVVAVALGDQAARSGTESIRKTAGKPVFDEGTMSELQGAGYTAGNMRFADLHGLYLACAGEGVDMPPWVEGS